MYVGAGVLYLHKIRMLVARWEDNNINGICFELHFRSRMWLTSLYSGGTFLRYVDEYKLRDKELDMRGSFGLELKA